MLHISSSLTKSYTTKVLGVIPWSPILTRMSLHIGYQCYPNFSRMILRNEIFGYFLINLDVVLLHHKCQITKLTLSYDQKLIYSFIIIHLILIALVSWYCDHVGGGGMTSEFPPAVSNPTSKDDEMVIDLKTMKQWNQKVNWLNQCLYTLAISL